MGDAANTQMFVDVWENTKLKWGDIQSATALLDQLKPDIRGEVVEVLVKRVREHPQNLDELSGDYRKYTDYWNNEVIELLYQHGTKRQCADWFLAKLKKEPVVPSHVVRNVPLWLAHTQPDSPLVAMLAKADKPELRLLVMDALRECPTPEHQELLKRLLKDPDPAVRAAAEKVSQQLKTLAAQRPAEYASDPASVASKPAG